MSAASKQTGTLMIWFSPFAGAFAVALFLVIRALVLMPDGIVDAATFIIWSIERASIGYFLALPLLAIAKRLGLRHIVGFMLLASLVAIPLEHYVSDPMNAWHPTEEELVHGFYWDAFIPAVALASVTGAMFSWGLRVEQKGQASA